MNMNAIVQSIEISIIVESNLP